MSKKFIRIEMKYGRRYFPTDSVEEFFAMLEKVTTNLRFLSVETSVGFRIIPIDFIAEIAVIDPEDTGSI